MAVKRDLSLIIRNFTFGVEDSLVSTVGLLAGIAVAGVDRETIIVTGIVLIFVEAFSMAVGSMLSEQSVEEYEAKSEVSLSKPAVAAVVMFFSYVISGLIPIAPYIFSDGRPAIYLSVVLTLVSLFLLGVLNAHINRVRAWKDGLQTLVMGGVAIAVGIIVGQLVGHV